MKKLMLALVLGIAVPMFSSAMDVTLYGSGGLVSVGTSIKICPNASAQVCARLSITAGEIKIITDGVSHSFSNAEIESANYFYDENGVLCATNFSFKVNH